MHQMFNHGTITAILFTLVGVIYDRATPVIARSAARQEMPLYTASSGSPSWRRSAYLVSGFIGEVLTFMGAFPVYRVMTIRATGVIITAATTSGDAHVPRRSARNGGRATTSKRLAAGSRINARRIFARSLAVIVLVLDSGPSRCSR